MLDTSIKLQSRSQFSREQLMVTDLPQVLKDGATLTGNCLVIYHGNRVLVTEGNS